MSSYITQNVNRTLVVAENTFTELEHFAQAAAANVTTASEPPQTPSSTSAATVSPPPPTDEQLQKEFRERYGANRTPDEHRAAWLAAHASKSPLLKLTPEGGMADRRSQMILRLLLLAILSAMLRREPISRWLALVVSLARLCEGALVVIGHFHCGNHGLTIGV